MPAMIEDMFYVGEVPWHGLGHNFEEPPTIDEAIVAAGLDFQVDLEPLFTSDGQKVNRQATIRQDTNEVLGTVGMRYNPLQNKDAFQFFQPFLDGGEAELHTAGLLAGSKVWILAKIKSDNLIIAKEDEVAKYVMLSHSHDGTVAVRVGFTPIRVVCANTLAYAIEHEQSKLLRMKHTKNTVDNLESVRSAMNLANQNFEATAEQFRSLAHKDISQADLKKYIKICIGKGDVEDKDLHTRTKNTIISITKHFETGRGNNLKSVRGTWWTAYNSITEWLSYDRGRSTDNRFNQLWFGGAAANINEAALKTALELAA